MTLPDLKSWTWYCVMVQSRVEYYNKSSSFTSPLCMQTEGNAGEVPDCTPGRSGEVHKVTTDLFVLPDRCDGLVAHLSVLPVLAGDLLHGRAARDLRVL